MATVGVKGLNSVSRSVEDGAGGKTQHTGLNHIRPRS